MARRHYANAIVSTPAVKFEEWMDTLRNQHEGAVPKDHINRIAKTVLRKCDPNQYLLSHATIVASVDTYEPKGVKTGRQMNQGVQIDVRWPDFRIKPECHELINNNADCWSRPLLLSTYRTFVGASCFLEHIQLPELSKGFIADAIVRDLGKTCYVDILVATDRKHKMLIQDILAGTVQALSMGCISLFTICTKCGNVAADDNSLCPCVLYGPKGAKFLDEDGVEQPIAELIGHVSVPNSNQFIEASWVHNPAFRGAVRRNILNADMTSVASKLNESAILYELRREQSLPDGIAKAASLKTAQGQEDFQDSADEPGAALSDAIDDTSDESPSDKPFTSPEEPKSDSSIDELLETAQKQVMQIIVDGLSEKLAPKPEDVGTVKSPPDISSNDNLVRASRFDKLLHTQFKSHPKLVKWASQVYKIVHIGGKPAIRKAGLKPKDLIVLSWIEDRINHKEASASLYKVAMQVGPLNQFPSKTSYIACCKTRIGHSLTEPEKQVLICKGSFSSLANC